VQNRGAEGRQSSGACVSPAVIFCNTQSRVKLLVLLREKWSALLAGEGQLRVEVTPFGKACLERVSLESTGLSWQHYRLLPE